MDHEISPLRQMAAHMIKAPKMFSGGNPLSLEFLYHGCFATLFCCTVVINPGIEAKSDYWECIRDSLNKYNEKAKEDGVKRFLSTTPLASQGASDGQINEVYHPVLLRLIEEYENFLGHKKEST